MADFTILSIDIGSTFGYAIGKSGVIIASGEVSLSPGASKVHPGHRWMKFQQFLHETCEKYKVDEIVFEKVTFVTSAQQMIVYGALKGQIEIYTLAYKLRLTDMPVATVKKEFAGSGHAKKPDMCNTAIRMGWKKGVVDTENLHNEADAIGLLCVVYKRRGIEPTFLGVERQRMSLDDSTKTLALDPTESLAVT